MNMHAKLEACARAAHESNKSYCMALGDMSQVHWEDAPEWQRKSAMNGVIGIIKYMNTPEQSHESWLADKKRDGWTYGPIKDVELKQHPCFVPFSALLPEQKVKDLLFHGVVHAMAKVVNLTTEELNVWQDVHTTP